MNRKPSWAIAACYQLFAFISAFTAALSMESHHPITFVLLAASGVFTYLLSREAFHIGADCERNGMGWYGPK